MKKFLSVFFVIGCLWWCPIAKAQCPPGASATESVYAFCSEGCGVLLTNWPAGVLVDIFGGVPMHVITEATISGTYNPASGATGNAFVCVPCNTPLTFASIVPQSSNGCVITNTNILPVTLNNFSASKSEGNTLLKWDVSLEQGIVQYYIERSNDGKVFKDISTIEGSGTTVINKTYTYLDASSEWGTVYYRLKITQDNGGISYSPVKLIDNSSELTIKAYPNPVIGNSFTIDVPVDLLPASITILDAQGRIIYQTKITQPTSTINADLTTGVYALKVIGIDNSIVIQKIIK
jgi:hypothetical protein